MYSKSPVIKKKLAITTQMGEQMTISLEHHDALLVVDLQNDFLDGGSLGVPGSTAIIPVVNQYIDMFTRALFPVFACRDWHPANHCSFVENGGLWPVHCVAKDHGSEFHPDLHLPPGTYIASKGSLPDREAYSALEGTKLEKELRAQSIERVFICGLATDYCVLETTRDLVKNNFMAVILQDAIKAVDVQPGDGVRAIREMLSLGALKVTLHDISP